MPISFSACTSISLVTRNGVGVGLGEGNGEGGGVADGVCAAELISKCGATIAVNPAAGTSFTNERRLRLVGFVFDLLDISVMQSLRLSLLLHSLSAGRLRAPVFHLQ